MSPSRAYKNKKLNLSFVNLHSTSNRILASLTMNHHLTGCHVSMFLDSSGCCEAKLSKDWSIAGSVEEGSRINDDFGWTKILHQFLYMNWLVVWNMFEVSIY